MSANLLHSARLSIAPTVQAIQVVRAALDNMARSHGLVPTATAKLHIILDEMLSNIIKHGYGSSDTSKPSQDRIDVTLQLEARDFSILISDGARPFDPTQPAFSVDEERPRLGGRGLDMVKALCNSITYARIDAHNVTTLTKAVTVSAKELDRMPPGLEIHETLAEGAATVALVGRIDSGNASHLTEHLKHTLKNGQIDVVLDLAKLEYLTSAGFRTLLIVSDAAEDAGGSLSLTNLNTDVRELFDLSGLYRAFEIT